MQEIIIYVIYRLKLYQLEIWKVVQRSGWCLDLRLAQIPILKPPNETLPMSEYVTDHKEKAGKLSKS